MDEKLELANIMKEYDSKIVNLYKRITKIEKLHANKVKRSDVRATIKEAIREVAE